MLRSAGMDVVQRLKLRPRVPFPPGLCRCARPTLRSKSKPSRSGSGLRLIMLRNSKRHCGKRQSISILLFRPLPPSNVRWNPRLLPLTAGSRAMSKQSRILRSVGSHCSWVRLPASPATADGDLPTTNSTTSVPRPPTRDAVAR